MSNVQNIQGAGRLTIYCWNVMKVPPAVGSRVGFAAVSHGKSVTRMSVGKKREDEVEEDEEEMVMVEGGGGRGGRGGRGGGGGGGRREGGEGDSGGSSSSGRGGRGCIACRSKGTRAAANNTELHAVGIKGVCKESGIHLIWKRIFTRSMGAMAVLDTMPATPPAMTVAVRFGEQRVPFRSWGLANVRRDEGHICRLERHVDAPCA